MFSSLLLQSADARDVLRAIVTADLPAKGLTHVASFRGIAQALGERWPLKSEAVWEFAHRIVQRRAPGSLSVKLNEVDLLLGFPDGTPAAAAARSCDVVSDVLRHFLGRADNVEQWVHRIPDLTNGFAPPAGATRAPPDPALDGAGSKEEVVTGGGKSQEPLLREGDARRPEARASWTSGSGEPQDIAMALRPVWSLKHGLVSSFRLYRGFRPTVMGFGPERERLDIAVLQHATGPDALGLLKEGTALHLPVALNTLLLQRTRLAYLATLNASRELFRRRVVLELEGVDTGVVPGRLEETVHLLRPYFRIVLASASGPPVSAGLLRSAGISGVIFDLAALSAPVTKTQLLERVSRSRASFEIVVLHGLSEGNIPDAELLAAGASHASSRPGEGIDDMHDAQQARRMAKDAGELDTIFRIVSR